MKRSHTSPHRFNALRLCSAQARRPRPPIVPARLEQLEERTLLSAALIKDINATPSNPRNLAAVGSTLYYTSTNASGGTNLYKTDGDAGDQVLLKSFPATSVVAISLDARAALGSKLFFVADDGTTGGELWVTDGTAGGTKLVKDIFSGSNSSMAPLAEGTFAVVAGSFYFVANDGSTANEIWKSDGSEAGTVILKDIRPGASLSSVPLGLTAFGSKLIFTAIDGVNGREVYASNGTAPGTVMLSNINPTGGSAPAEFTVVGTTLFFAATDGSGDRELWKTDGTPANTVRVKDIRPGSTSSNPNWLTALGNTLYFAANDGTGRELWKSDGTAGGTVKVQDLSGEPNGSQPTSVVALGSHIIFMTATDSGGSDLFRTDGTTTEKLADLTAFPVPAPDSTTAPRKLVVAGSKLFITFIDPATGRFALWASNGTAAGTLKLRNLQPGASFASNILNAGLMVGLGGQLFFADKDQAHGVELWKSDGTQAGTLFVKDINPGTGNSLPRELTAMGGNVYFSAKAASGADQLWKSNGTSAGSSALESFTTGAAIGSSISHPVQVGNIIIFFADDGVTGKELWKTDGSTTGTTLLKDFSPLGGVTPFWTTALNGQFYFLVGGNSSVSGLWRTDGSAAGTVLFKNINLVTARPNVLVFNGSLYFALETATNVQLWRHNATTGETGTILADLPKSDDSITNLTVANNIIFFLTQDSRNTLSIERRLWTSDGTPAGTAELVTFNAEPTASTEIIGFGNFAYFRANDGNTGSELWRSDGTAFGTTVVQELAPGTGSSTPLHLRVVGGALYFSAVANNMGRELWRISSPGAAPQLVLDLNAGPAGSILAGSRFTQLGSTLYFMANNGQVGLELWKTDGGDPVLVKDVQSGPGHGLSLTDTRFFPIGSTLYFSANDGSTGLELWKTDGIPAGTTRVEDINPDEPSSRPRVLGSLPTGLIVAASNGTHGEELILVTAADPANNQAPVIAPIPNQTINEGVAFTLPITASDPDAGQTLSFSLDPGAPAGLSINASTGALSWNPSESQGPKTYDVTVRVLDNGSPSKTASRTFQITADEVNQAPILNPIPAQNAIIGTPLVFTATATDPDIPPQARVYSLMNGPAGAVINASSGVFSWTPAPGTGNTSFIVRVSDTGNPSLFDEQTVHVTVQPAPVIVINVGLVRKRNTISGIQIVFSDDLNGAVVGNKTLYALVKPGRDRTFGTSDDVKQRIRRITFDPNTNTLLITPRTALQRKGKYQLTINGLVDVFNQPIDGDRDGQLGGVYTAQFAKGGVTLASTSAVPSISPTAVDFVLIDSFFKPRNKVRT